jgi:hypothetical protein
MEYCGIKTSNIKASTKSSRSKTGKEMKPRRSHSRRRCYKTDDKSLNTTECMVGKSSRCVIRGNNPQLLEKRRSQNRNMYVIRSRDGKNKKSVRKNVPIVTEKLPSTVSIKPVVLESKMPVTPVVLESKMPVTPVVEEPLKNTPSPKVRKGRSVSPKSKSSVVLGMGPYVFNFVADTNFPKKKGSKETTLSKVQKYYNDILTKNKTNPNYKNIDTFNVDSVDETEYKGTLTLIDPPTSIKELNELIKNILSPDFILDSSDIHIFPDYIEDSLELDGQKINQAGGRKKLNHYK